MAPPPSGDPRRVVMLTVRPALELIALARRFQGHIERYENDTTAVVWRGVSTVEPAVRMAQALHAEASVGVGVVSGDDSSAQDGPQSRALRLARTLSDLAPMGVTLLCAPPQTIPPSLRCTVYGGIHPDPAGAPVAVAQVVEIARDSPRQRVRVIGRDTELAEFRRIIARVVRTGTGAIVHIQGDAGIGKSAVLGELRRIASASGFAVHQTLNVEHPVDRAHCAAAVLVHSLIEVAGASPHDIVSSIERAVAEGGIDPDHLPFARDLLDLPMGPEERGLFDAMEPATRQAGHTALVQGLVDAATARKPQLVEIEDMHWASDETRHAVASIAARVADSPLVLVTSSRRAGDPIAEAWVERAEGKAVSVWALDRLGGADAQAMAAAVLSRRRAPWMLSTSRYVDSDAVLQCVEHSGGHPLLLEQLLLGWEDGIDPSAPAPIAALVAARQATLSLDERRAVELAAAYGTRFDVDVISAARQQGPWDVGAAVTAGLVASEARGHRFTHALVRDAIYSGLTDAERRRLHRALGRVLEDPGLRAEHLERAGDSRAASSRLEAARLEHAAARSGLALSHIERGLAVAQGDELRGSLMELAGSIHTDRGRPAAALAAFEQAAALATSPIDRCRALLGSVSALRLQARHDDATLLLTEADALATEHAADELIGLTAYYRGGLLFAKGDVAGCTAQHERAVHHAQLAGQPRTEALALSGLGDAYYAQSRIATALEVIGRCIRLSRTHGLGRIEVGNLYMMGALRALENDVAGGLRDCIAAARMATRVGNRRAEMLAALNVGICLTVQGETASALEWITTATRIAEQMNAGVFVGISWAFEARARILGGEREAGLARAREALVRARDGGMPFFGGIALGALARGAPSMREREQAIDEGERLLSQPCMSHNYFYFYEDAIEVWVAAERWDRVERSATALDAIDAREPIGRCRLLAARARALARMGRAPSNEAVLVAARVVLADIIAAGLQPLRPALERMLAQAEAHDGARR